MAETLSPNLTIQKRKTSVSVRLQSPTSPFFIGSNDDKLERAQARAARAAAIRRRIVEDDLPLPSSPSNSGLDGVQIMELFRNCIKLASENVCFLLFLKIQLQIQDTSIDWKEPSILRVCQTNWDTIFVCYMLYYLTLTGFLIK